MPENGRGEGATAPAGHASGILTGLLAIAVWMSSAIAGGVAVDGDRKYTDTAIDLTRPLTVEGDPVFRHRFAADQLDPKGKPYRFAVFAYRVFNTFLLGYLLLETPMVTLVQSTGRPRLPSGASGHV